jgi:hypothetical protein
MRTQKIYFSFSAAIFAAALTAGCGGAGGGFTPVGSDTFKVEDPGTSTASGVATESVTAPSGTAIATNVTVGSSTYRVLVPGGTSITAGDEIDILLPGAQYVSGLRSTGTGGAIVTSVDDGAEVDSGLVVAKDGTVRARSGGSVSGMVFSDGALGRPARSGGSYDQVFHKNLKVQGPLAWNSQTVNGDDLTIQKFYLVNYPINKHYEWIPSTGTYRVTRQIGIPKNLQGVIPRDGRTSFGLTFNYFCNMYFAGSSHTLTITKRNGKLQKTETEGSDGKTYFANALNDGASDRIPNEGVKTVVLEISP